MQNELEQLLNNLCTEWGFCIPPIEADKIIKKQKISAEQFAFSVLKAEGFNPENEIEWKRKIKNKFIEAFGNELS